MKSFSALVGVALVLVIMALFSVSFFAIFAASASAVVCDNDDSCEAGENPLWCPNDCAPTGFCGDGFCDINEQGQCPSDCGAINASCTPTNGGAEYCDGVDNNCDGIVDDGLPMVCRATPTNLNLAIPTTASQTFEIRIANPNSDDITVKWHKNGTEMLDASKIYNFFANPDLVGQYAIKVVVNNTNTTEVVEKEWLLNVTDAGWVTFWGQVTDAETGEPLAGKKLSFYQDTEIESKYSDVNQLEAHMYTTWQNLTPKATPDAVTNAAGYFYADLADGTWNYVIQGSREDEMELVVNNSNGPKKRDSEVNENIPVTNFNAEGHILYMGKYEKQDENDEANGNKYTCGQKIRFVMFGVNNGETDETITFAVQDHTSNGGPNATIIYTGNISNPDESLTTLAGNKSEKYFDWQISCPKTEDRYDIHVVWNGEVWHKIGNFFVIADTTDPTIIISGPTNIEIFTNENYVLGYTVQDPAAAGTMPQILNIQLGSIAASDESIAVTLDKNISDGTAVDMTGVGGTGQYFNLSYNESGRYTARLTANDSSGNTAIQDINVTVWITEAEADAIATPFYTNYCLLNDTGIGLGYDVSVQPIGMLPFNADIFAASPEERIGHEYCSDGGDGSGDCVAPGEFGYVDTPTEACSRRGAGSPAGAVLAINLSTSTEFYNALYNYFSYLNTSCAGLTGICPNLP
jgi:hypothetical protein